MSGSAVYPNQVAAQIMPATLPELNKLRKVVRAKTTRISNKLTEIWNDAVMDRPTKIYQLKASLNDFLKSFERLEAIDNSIYIVTDDDDPGDVLDADALINKRLKQ